MSQITNISTSVLKVHPRNTEFFDDIEGDNYTQFKNSIKEDGIITPLIVASDMTIISGHQRYQAAKDLGITQVPVIIREDLEDEDEQLKKLLATNFGRLKNNPVKQGRVYEQYEKLCGVRQGSLNTEPKFSAQQMTQSEIAKELGVSVDTIQNLKKLTRLSPELQQLIENGQVKYTTALNVWGKLSNKEQEEFIKTVGKDHVLNLTAKETKELMQEYNLLKQENEELRNRKPVEVVPSDYEELKRQLKDLQVTNSDLKNKLVIEANKKKLAIGELEEEQQKEKLMKEINSFAWTINGFIKAVGGLIYLTDYVNEVPKSSRDLFTSSAKTLLDWANQLNYNLENKEDIY